MSTDLPIHPLYALTIEGSRDPLTDEVDYELLTPRTLMVRRDSGIQTVYAQIRQAMARARRFRPPFREYMIEFVKAYLGGLIALSSEQGAFAREFSTSRASVPIGVNEGQPVSDLDVIAYEGYLGQKGKFRNNPKEKGFGINF